MTYTITGTIDGFDYAFATPSFRKVAARWAELIEHPGNELEWKDQDGRLYASTSPAKVKEAGIRRLN